MIVDDDLKEKIIRELKLFLTKYYLIRYQRIMEETKNKRKSPI